MGNACGEPQHQGGQKVLAVAAGDLKGAKTPSDTAATVNTMPPQPTPVTPKIEENQVVVSPAPTAQVKDAQLIVEKSVEPEVPAPQDMLKAKAAKEQQNIQQSLSRENSTNDLQ